MFEGPHSLMKNDESIRTVSLPSDLRSDSTDVRGNFKSKSCATMIAMPNVVPFEQSSYEMYCGSGSCTWSYHG